MQSGRHPLRGRKHGVPQQQQQQPPVDREKTCPFLLKVFYKHGSQHKSDEFGIKGKEPAECVHVHVWKDSTLQEVIRKTMEQFPELLTAGREQQQGPVTRINVDLVFMDLKAKMVRVRPIGSVKVAEKQLQKKSSLSFTSPSGDENRTLRDVRVEPGDYVDMALLGEQ